MPRSRIVSLAVVAAALLVVVALANVATSGPEDAAEEALLDRIQDLEQRVVELETRLSELQARSPIIQLDGTAPLPGPPAPFSGRTLVRPDLQPQPALPRGTQQGEINGMPFYIIPLQDSPSASRASGE